MMRARRGLSVIDVLSAVLFVGAAALYLLPVRIDTTAQKLFAGPAPLPSVPVAQLTSGDEAAVIANANILSSTRRAPEKRYVSPDRAEPTGFELPAPFATAPESATPDSIADIDAVPSLFGIVSIDGITRALLRLSENDINPVLLREGDSRGRYRVVTIRSNAVVVAGPAGNRTLRLAKPARGDSTGKQL